MKPADSSSPNISSASGFSASYAVALSRFVASAGAAGGVLDQVTNPERGPGSEVLTTDLAWFGPASAERVLVVISGTHGVEGYCGPGVQSDWLQRGEASRVPSGIAVLLIHAINPYGFAWNRRVTEDNVDLNRNWVDFDQPLPANPAYATLHTSLCQTHWSEDALQRTAAEQMAFIAANGMPPSQAAVSGGQYTHADGLFYGGLAPTWSRLTQTRILRERLGGAGQVAVIDIHTGLGMWGFGEQIVPVARESTAFVRAARWYGGAITSPSGGTSASADISGDGLWAAAALLPHAEVTVMALEFGTQPILQVLQALRADAWLHAHGDPLSAQGDLIRRQVRDTFYGDRDDWKGMVTGQSLLAIRQAFMGLQESESG
ncbi:MAG: DUF2817 domain-containing protein [Gammaproteobacteria bacterium]|nr:DUF2817 domain-containing protein [Gammaproteobacteria bacterium]